MRGLFIASAALLLLAVAGCAQDGDAWANPPVSTAPGSGPQQPQSAGSLPPGAAVNAPILPSGGELLSIGTP